LEASESSNIGLRELDEEFDLVYSALLGKFVAVVGRLGTKKILLNSKGDLFGSNEDDDEDWMGVTVDKLIGETTKST
jgi:hypothetical protein